MAGKFVIKCVLLMTLLFNFPKGVALIEPTSGFAFFSSIVAGFFAGYRSVKCRDQECCTERWIGVNGTELTMALKAKVYGQHLADKAVLKYIKAHFKSNEPSKALALSFHGTTGTGKTYVSRIIAEHVYKKGMKSQFVHVLSPTKEFPHKDMVPLYKDKLRDLIEKRTALCERSLFIFDEIDKMPPGLIDTVKPYLDFYEQLEGTDYRKAMFLFLSNTAGEEISQHALNHWRDEKIREHIQLNDMEEIIKTAVVKTKYSGLWHSDLFMSHRITAYIPFLPLEKWHIKQCIRHTLLEKKIYETAKNIDEDKVQDIANLLQYYPEDAKLYSVTGCHHVPDKVDYIMEDMDEP